MEKIKEDNSERTDSSLLFKSKVQRILYPDDKTSSSDDDALNNDQLIKLHCQPKSAAQPDNNVELLKRHEEFITRQLNAARKIQLKGILTISSKHCVEELVGNDVPEEEQSDGKELRLPQTGKNKRRKLMKKRRKERELTQLAAHSTKKLKTDD